MDKLFGQRTATDWEVEQMDFCSSRSGFRTLNIHNEKYSRRKEFTCCIQWTEFQSEGAHIFTVRVEQHHAGEQNRQFSGSVVYRNLGHSSPNWVGLVSGQVASCKQDTPGVTHMWRSGFITRGQIYISSLSVFLITSCNKSFAVKCLVEIKTMQSKRNTPSLKRTTVLTHVSYSNNDNLDCEDFSHLRELMAAKALVYSHLPCSVSYFQSGRS